MNATMAEPKHTSLYYREGSSDKEYHVRLVPRDSGFVVNFEYGRRGSTLNTGTKTTDPVDYETATVIFDKLVREKKAKGYSEGPNGTPYQQSDKAAQVSGIVPQLLNPIDEARAHRLIDDERWCMQPKMDGRRLLIRKEGDSVVGINKRGLIVNIPRALVDGARGIPKNYVIDGECIGEMFHAFDVLFDNGADIRGQICDRRFARVLDITCRYTPRNIVAVPLYVHPTAKRTAFESYKAQKAEGVVFKDRRSPYTPGRPSSGGSQLKFKFIATLSAVVAKVNAQRSVELRLLNGTGWVPAGNVTIPPNHVVPTVGAVVEVRYLYALPESGALYQPVYLGARTDVEPHECVQSQLKYKPTSEQDEES